MKCTLTQEQQKKLLKKVYKDLETISNNNTPFVLKDYIKSIYDAVYNKTNDKALATHYAQILPDFISVSAATPSLLTKLVKQGLDFTELAGLMDSFNNIENTESYLGLEKDEIKALREAEKEFIQEQLDDAPLKEDDISRIDNALLESSQIGTLNHVMGAITIAGNINTIKEAKKDGSGETLIKNIAVPIPQSDLYPALRAKVNFLENNAKKPLSELPYKLKAVKGKEVSIDSFLTHKQDTNQEKYTEAVKAGSTKEVKAYEEGVVLVVTDKYGSILKFDEDGNPSDSGIEIHFTIPKTKEQIFTQQSDDLSKLTGEEQKSLQKFRKLQRDKIDKIREAVNNGKTVMLDITKINPGFADVRYFGQKQGEKTILRKSSEFVKELNQINIDFDLELDPLTGQVKIAPKNLNYKIQDKRKAILQTKNLNDQQIETVVELLTNTSLKYENELGESFPLSNNLRQDLILQYIRLSKTETPKIEEDIKKEQNLISQGKEPIKIDFIKSGDNFVIKIRLNGETKSFSPNDNTLKDLLRTTLKNKQLNISKKYLNKKYTPFSIQDNKLIFESEKDYNEFIFENTNTSLYLNTNNTKVSQTIYFDVSENQLDLTKMEQDENPVAVKVEIPKRERRKVTKLNQKGIGDINLDKSVLIDNTATPEQIKQAKEWFDKSPIKKHIEFEELFNIVNSKAFATFNKHGIRLYKGSNYTDLYHESFHAFTQLFLSPKQKLDLYKELKSKSGSFTNFKGNKVKYSDASYLEIEELLAEDFRLYVLSEGTKVLKESPKRNTIFRKMLDFLKFLFGNMTYKQVIASNNDTTINSKVKELYDALYTGNINEEMFSLNNAVFEDLNAIKIENIDPEQYNYEFTEKESVLAVKSLDNLVGEFIQNMVLTEGAQWTTSFFRDPRALIKFYDYAAGRLKQQSEAIEEQIEKETDVNLIQELEDKYEFIARMAEQFTNVQDVLTGKETKGIVYFHKQYSDLLNLKDKTFDSEDLTNLMDSNNNLSDIMMFDRSGNELSNEELAAQEVIFLIKSTLNTKGKVDTLGFTELDNYKQIWFKLSELLHDTKDFDQMIIKMQEASPKFLQFKSIISRLGKLDTDNNGTFRLQTQFWDAFNKSLVNLVSMNINTQDTETGIIMGSVSSRIHNVIIDINNNFKNTEDNKFIIKNLDNENILDKELVLETFKDPKSNTYTLNPQKQIEFLNAIGIPVEKKISVKNGLKNLDVNQLYEFLYKLSNLNPVYKEIVEKNPKLEVEFKDVTKSFGILYKEFGITGTSPKTGHQGGLIRKLIELYAKTSDVVNSYTVTNAEGELQNELTTNSSLNVMINGINDVSSFKELYSKPEFAHFDPKINPGILQLETINRLFDLNKPESGYPKKKKAKLNIKNLSGLQRVIEGEHQNGKATASLDRPSKLLYDIHAMLDYFMPELMRHADKSASMSITIGDLYIDVSDFTDDSKFKQKFYKYLQIEFERIKRKNLYAGTGILEKQAGEFMIFADIFNEETKDKLKKLIANNIDIYVNDKFNLREIKAFDSTLVDSMNKQLSEYLNERSKEYLNELKDEVGENFYISEKLKDKVKNISENKQRETIIKAFTANTLIHNIETLYLLYGDPAQFNHLKDEFHKRNAPISSGGRLFRMDKYAINHINRRLKPVIKPENKVSSFAEKLGFEPIQFNQDKVLGTAVFDDIKPASAYLNKYKQAFKDFYLTKYNEKQAEELATKAVKAYSEGEMTVGDAQGYITIDAYKALAIASSRWTDKQEQLYDRLINDQYVDPEDIMEFFPPRKYQYYGPLANQDVALNALHKYSLLPLIPQLIKDTNLEVLNKRLMKQSLGIGMFKSASKITTLNKKEDINQVYDKEGNIIQEGNFTNNPIILDYLKDQVDTHFTFKGKVNFPTQIRKLILSGLYSGGNPKSPEAKKLVENYEQSLKELQDIKREDLYNELKIEGKNDSEKTATILEFLKKELSREELADHELEELNVTSTRELIKDLSLSPSAAKLEKVITSLVNRRLVKYGVKGEGLVQASSVLSEKTNLKTNFKKPTQEQIEQYGTNDLRFYELENGKIRAMEVKIALQGDFLKLLRLDHKDGSRINTLARLNEMMADKEWKTKYKNLLTLVGVRIPTQELNSTEVMEIKEFLDPSAGNILMAPFELVAKTGSDFDIDKMFTLMPNIFSINNDLTATYTDEELNNIYNEKVIKAWEKAKEDAIYTEDLAYNLRMMISDMTGTIYSKEDFYNVMQAKNIPFTFEEFKKKYKTKKAENNLLSSMIDIIQYKDNFLNLIKPLDGQEVKDEAAKLAKFNEKRNYNKTATKIIDPLYNIDKHQANNIGKAALGIGAIFNTYNALLNRWGAQIEKHFGLSKNEIKELMVPDEQLNSEQLSKKKEILSFNAYLPMNKVNGIIDFSSEYDVENNHRIGDLISQLMNGWVDIAKDTWVFNIQGNKELAPTLMTMLKLGVPLEIAGNFISNPIIKEYAKTQRWLSSPFFEIMSGYSVESFNIRNVARDIVLKNMSITDVFDFFSGTFKPHLADQKLKRTDSQINRFSKLSKKEMIETLQKHQSTPYSNLNKELFLYFLQLEQLSSDMTKLTQSTNFDTTTSPNMFDTIAKDAQAKNLKYKSLLTNKTLDNITEKSMLKEFNITNELTEIIEPLFGLRNNKKFNLNLAKLLEKNASISSNTYKDKSRTAEFIKNDMMIHVIQKEISGFNSQDVKSFETYAEQRGLKFEEDSALDRAVLIQDGVLKINRKQFNAVYNDERLYDTLDIKNRYPGKDGKRDLEYERNLFKTNGMINMDIFIKFVLERAYQKYISTREETESKEAFEKRISRQALTENMNINHIFKSHEDNLPRKIMNLIKKYPSLKQYDFVNQLKITSSKVKEFTGQYRNNKLVYINPIYYNIELKTQKLKDVNLINRYYREFKELADPSVKKVENDNDNRMISNLFNKLIYFSVYQSGFNSSSNYGLSRITPKEEIKNLIEQNKEYIESIQENNLEDFAVIFIQNNNNPGRRYRFKDYVNKETLTKPQINPEQQNNNEEDVSGCTSPF